MKTKRRHELQTNQLADSLAHGMEAIAPYSRGIVAALLAAVVILVAWGYLANRTRERTADAWTEYFEALSSPRARDLLTDISERYVGTLVADFARLELADVQLMEGTNQLFVDKPNSKDKLRQAAEKYRAVLAESSHNLLIERAMFGLARAHEALGSLEDARKEYKELADRWPGGAYAAPALARIKDLESQPTKEFYDWLAKYEPARPMSREPGTPGQRPDFLKDPLDDSSLKLPSSIGDRFNTPKFSLESTTDSSEKKDDAKPSEEPAEKPVDKPTDDQP